MNEDVVLYNGDCLEFIKTISSYKNIIVIADPPYGINLNTDYTQYPGGKTRDKVFDDDKPFDFSKWIDFQAKEQLWFGAENYINLPMPSNTWLVWDKYPTDKSDGRLSGQFELIWSKKKHKRVLLRVKAINTSWLTVKENVGHPTQKPIELYKLLIQKFSKIGDTIFDPYMGTGSSGIAAKELGRKYIGCEIEQKWFDIAKDRIEKAVYEPKLLGEEID